MNSSGTLKIARNGYIVMAVVFCALGIFLMAVPEKAVKIICVLAGILFIADGIIKNTYRTLMTRGMKGCYVYCTDTALAQYFKKLLKQK